MMPLLAAAVLVPLGTRGPLSAPLPAGGVPYRVGATVRSPRGAATAVKFCP